MRHRIKLLVVACNTASATALPVLAETLKPVPVLGVIEPGAEAAVKAAPSGRIAVIATEGTVNGGAYVRAIHARNRAAVVTQQACPLFVALAEEGLTEGPIVELVAKRYLDPLLAGTPPDCLVLGCTHFPGAEGHARARRGCARETGRQRRDHRDRRRTVARRARSRTRRERCKNPARSSRPMRPSALPAWAKSSLAPRSHRPMSNWSIWTSVVHPQQRKAIRRRDGPQRVRSRAASACATPASVHLPSPTSFSVPTIERT